MGIYEGIMSGLEEALEHAEGERWLRTAEVSGKYVEPLCRYRPEEIREIRCGLGMTQALFAGFMGVSTKTVEAWESGRNSPEGPARRILAMVQRDPQLPEKYRIITDA